MPVPRLYLVAATRTRNRWSCRAINVPATRLFHVRPLSALTEKLELVWVKNSSLVGAGAVEQSLIQVPVQGPLRHVVLCWAVDNTNLTRT